MYAATKLARPSRETKGLCGRGSLSAESVTVIAGSASSFATTPRSFARPAALRTGPSERTSTTMPGLKPRPMALRSSLPVTWLSACGSMKSRSGSTDSRPVTGAPTPAATRNITNVVTSTRRGLPVTRRAIAASMARA